MNARRVEAQRWFRQAQTDLEVVRTLLSSRSSDPCGAQRNLWTSPGGSCEGGCRACAVHSGSISPYPHRCVCGTIYVMSVNRAYLKVLFGETHGILTFKLTEKSATNFTN